MAELLLDREKLARHLKTKMENEKLSIRTAAKEVGCSPATFGRLLQGEKSPSFPEGNNLIRAVSWLGKSLEDYQESERVESTIVDVEMHLRGLRDLPSDAVEGLVAMVKAVYDERRLDKDDDT